MVVGAGVRQLPEALRKGEATTEEVVTLAAGGRMERQDDHRASGRPRRSICVSSHRHTRADRLN